MRARPIVTVIVLLAACDGHIGGGPDDDAGVARPPCEVPVELEPATSTVAPRGVLVLHASGGSGEHRFSIEDDGATGTRIGDTTGVLVAGTLAGAVTVRADDVACDGAATATITVTLGLVIEPGTVEVAPGGAIAFVVRGGAGPFDYALARDASGATIEGGAYTAGSRDGDDVVRATDRATGASADATVRVRAGAALRLPAPRIAIPVGATHAIRIGGGSGYVDATESSDAITIADGVVTASAPGRADVELVDRYTGARATWIVEAVSSLEAPVRRVGDRTELDQALAGDFDEDGDVDALLAMPGSGIAGHRQGAVLIYRNDGGRLAATPARVITGARRDDALGSAVALGDLDGDGHVDLVIGAWQADVPAANAGGVFVYRGAPGMLFEAEPSLAFAGTTGSDRFGVSLAVCDFDGDGDQDLAVGAADAENREIAPRNDQEGAVYVFPSYGGRYLSSAGQVLFGAMPDGSGGWTSFRDMRFGGALAAGDVDGDGRCDLAVQALRAEAATANDGAVLVFRGRVAAVAGGEGGLEDRPSMVIAATETGDRGSRFGQTIAIGDLDGDGLAELAIGQHGHDIAGGTDAGAVRVFRGRALGAPMLARVPSDAEWTHEASEGSRFYGHAVRIADADGGPELDLVVSDSRAALEGSTLTRPGVLRVFPGRAGSLPDAAPSIEIEGTSNEERFAQAHAALGGGRFLALAVLADVEGLDDGAVAEVSESERVALELPGNATGRRYGLSVAVVGDLDGDGLAELAIGSPRQSDMRTAADVSRGIDHGAVLVHRGRATGYAAAPDVTLFDHPGHSESDLFGEAVAAAGDFDGDGRPDLAVLARQDDQPAAFDAAIYAPDAACGTTARSDVGAVFVYRGVASGGVATTPSFVIYGPLTSRTVQAIAGSIDADGDGRDDLVLGGPNWIDAARMDGRVGGVGLVHGRAADAAGRITVICGADWIGWGDAVNDELGSAIVGLGDLDGDGCDDFAAGAPLVDRTGATDEGAVRVYFGFGGASCPATSPASITLRPFDRTSSAGRALAATDLDGDGLLELIAGAPRYATAAGEVGRVYVVTGARLAAQRGATMPIALVDPDGAVLDGIDPGERAGSALAAIAGQRAIAIGGSFAAVSGIADTGGVRVFRWTTGALDRSPIALVSGETVREGSELGGALASARLGSSTFLVTGAPWGHAQSLESGSVYVTGL